MDTCRCRIPDWRRLRKALELSQHDFAERVGVTRMTIHRWERVPHRCPSRYWVRQVRLLLANNRLLLHRLVESGYPWPYLDDVHNPTLAGERVGPRCQIDGIPLAVHPRCTVCQFLIGPGHESHTTDALGRCEKCVGETLHRREVRRQV